MGPRLSLQRLNRATLDRQGLIERRTGSVAEVVGRLAGLQAQHADWPYVALWSRRHGQQIDDLQSALTNRSVVKATLMRATLHLVAAGDFASLDVASSDGPLASWAPTARRAGVDLGELNQTLLDFCDRPRTVADIGARLQEAYPDWLSGAQVPSGVRNSGFRMASAAGGLVHVPPSGLWRSHGRPSYIAARLWLGDGARPRPEEALKAAVERYLGAYGPASEEDILKWIGQRRITRVRAAIEALGDRIVRHTGHDERVLVDLADQTVPDEQIQVPARFLSRWDSVLIGYDIRDRILPDTYREAVIKENGDFRPTFLVDGFVAGLWSVKTERGEAVLSLNPLARVPKVDRLALEEEGERLVRYVEPDAESHGVAWES